MSRMNRLKNYRRLNNTLGGWEDNNPLGGWEDNNTLGGWEDNNTLGGWEDNNTVSVWEESNTASSWNTTTSSWEESNTASSWNTTTNSLEESNTANSWDTTTSSWGESNTASGWDATTSSWGDSNTNNISSSWDTKASGLEENNTISGRLEDSNTVIDLGDTTGSNLVGKKNNQDEKQIIEIVRHIANNNSFIIYGSWLCHQWQCRHKPQCATKWKCEDKDKIEIVYVGECQHKPQCIFQHKCRNKLKFQYKKQWQCENKCDHEWQIPYDQESFKNYIEKIPERPLDFFTQRCDRHVKSKKTLISSFLLYTSKNSNEKPTIEIIRHLELNNHYKVFGNWKCPNCRKRWKSAHTWISLQKFIEKTPGDNLNRDDYIMQGCEECKSDKSIILNYKPLIQTEDGKEHKRNLCAKCQVGEICFETGTHYGDRK